jgi:hypothetical protein
MLYKERGREGGRKEGEGRKRQGRRGRKESDHFPGFIN